MGALTTNVRRLRTQLKRDVRRLLAETMAPDLERQAKQDAGWSDDTGSARASITAYVDEVDDPRKNYDDPAWLRARTEAGVSRYGNDQLNYRPHEEQLATHPDAMATLILTQFVGYAPELEAEHNTLFRAFEQNKRRFLDTCADSLSGTLKTFKAR